MEGGVKMNSLKTIVISDLHLGLNDWVSEDVANRPKLASFIHKIRQEKLADELVIAGDFLDQWIYPADADLPRDSKVFYQACAKNNAEVIEALSALIKSGIPVIYVPGNHDMTLSHEILSEILPGIRQARDVPGLGRYRTGIRGEVVIEHSHRYEIVCAPDTITNAELMEYGYPILPFGYIFARVSVTSAIEGLLGSKDPSLKREFPAPAKPDVDDIAACNAYAYWKFCTEVLNELTVVRESLDEKFIKVAVDGFAGQYSLSDLIPTYQSDGSWDAGIYRNLVENWEEVQRRNLVPSPVSVAYSLEHAADNKERFEVLPARVYFDVDPSVDVVVFGHTHVPGYKEFSGYSSRKIFANSGTWVDNNIDDPKNNATFVMVDSTPSGNTVQTLKVLGDGKVEDIVWADNDHIIR